MRELCVLLLLLVGDALAGFYERCPPACHCLDTHIDCSRRALSNVPITLPSWTSVLELQGNKITEVSPTAFIGLDNLVAIDLSENDIESFSRLVFAYTPNLQSLILRKNRLASVPLGIESLRALHRLDLKGNEISKLSSIDVSRLAKIDVVDLARNSIQDLPTVVLVNLADSKITRLDLSNNAISKLRSRAFSSLHTLRSLRLSRNKIDSIDKVAFDGLVALRSLDLSRNRLSTVRALAFSALASLHNLTLSRNMIASLEDGAFWGLEQLHRLNLADNKLTALTGGWLYGMLSLVALDVSSNGISWIEPSVWALCPTLEWLSLAANRLRSLPPSVFKKLTRLQYLSLADNHIDVLHNGAMTGLNVLTSLDLSGNGLAVCVEDGSVLANTSLPSLHHLNFASNRIRVIPPRAFHNFPAVQHLYLSDNPIASIQQGAFEPLRLKQLHMNTSSLVCDCELKWFSQWLFASGLSKTSILTVCLHPSSLQGIDVATINSANLTCVDNSPRARLLSQPAMETKALVGSEVRLHCTGYGASPLEMSWKVNRQGRSRVLTNDATTHFTFNRTISSNASVSDFAVEYLYSEVRLSEIGFSDEAEYQCIVRNHYGAAYSLRAKIVVNQQPKIVYSPSNVSVLRGGNVKMRCSAQGVPPPSVKWQKDGGDTFPAALDRRLHVRANDDNLYMMNVTQADAGLYTCHVSNTAGFAHSSAFLTVFDVDFWPRVEEQQVQSQSTVYFNCSSNIEPPLTIEWYRDDEHIDPHTAPSRFAFKRHQQILVISEVRSTDTGVYSCELVVQGSVLSRSESRLRVLSGGDDSSKRRPDDDTQKPTSRHHMYLMIVVCVALSVLSTLIAILALLCCSTRCMTWCYRGSVDKRRYSAVKRANKAPPSGCSPTTCVGTETTTTICTGVPSDPPHPPSSAYLFTSI